MEAVGFQRAPRYLGVDEQGRDVFAFVRGDVAVAPYPAWAQRDGIISEVGALLREFHEAMSGFDPGSLCSAELADPRGGPVLCHNDVCPENVVFREGKAVALLDFDLAAPGRALWDVARTARMWVPMAVPGTSRSWPGPTEVWRRLGVFARAYRLDPGDGDEFADVLLTATRQGQDWVRAKVAAGEPSFVEMWDRFGLRERYAADLAWIAAHRSKIAEAAGSAGPTSPTGGMSER
ncbi:phosphotransferase [Dactylosporangium sp. NPDC051541]|uniref:phosphotransferase n=1 Tax=Dactylosporangium sp. NPDC051541 TaxID=3363977 RepID=UPI0037B75288